MHTPLHRAIVFAAVAGSLVLTIIAITKTENKKARLFDWVAAGLDILAFWIILKPFLLQYVFSSSAMIFPNEPSFEAPTKLVSRRFTSAPGSRRDSGFTVDTTTIP